MNNNDKVMHKKYAKPIIFGFCLKEYSTDSENLINKLLDLVKESIKKDPLQSVFEVAILKYYENQKESKRSSAESRKNFNFNFDYLIQEKLFHKDNQNLSELFKNARKLFYRRIKVNKRRGTLQLKPLLILFVDSVKFDEKDKNLRLILTRRTKNKFRYKLNVFVKGELDKKSLLTNYKNINLYKWETKFPEELFVLLRQEANI
jgi:hypothetical protein